MRTGLNVTIDLSGLLLKETKATQRLLVRKTAKLAPKGHVKVDKAYHFCVYKNSNSTNIWNQGFWTSAPLPLSIGSLAEHEPSRKCQQNKLYKPRNMHIHMSLCCTHNYLLTYIPFTSKRRSKSLWNGTLPSQSAKGAFLSIVSGLKKLFNSINWGKRSLKFIILHFHVNGTQKHSVAAYRE